MLSSSLGFLKWVYGRKWWPWGPLNRALAQGIRVSVHSADSLSRLSDSSSPFINPSHQSRSYSTILGVNSLSPSSHLKTNIKIMIPGNPNATFSKIFFYQDTIRWGLETRTCRRQPSGLVMATMSLCCCHLGSPRHQRHSWISWTGYGGQYWIGRW